MPDYLEAVEPADGWVSSRVIPGFKVRAEWLDPANLPAVADCLAAIAAELCESFGINAGGTALVGNAGTWIDGALRPGTLWVCDLSEVAF